MIAACDESDQVGDDQSDKADYTDRGHRNGRGKCGNRENYEAQCRYGQSDDCGLQFTACQYIQMSGDQSARDRYCGE